MRLLDSDPDEIDRISRRSSSAAAVLTGFVVVVALVMVLGSFGYLVLSLVALD